MAAAVGCAGDEGGSGTPDASDGPAPASAAEAEARRARVIAAQRREQARRFVLASPGAMPPCSEASDDVGRPVDRPRWLRGVAVTEYFPVPEAWFSGRRVRAPGLRSRHRVDWLYSARGVTMQGEGVGLDGRHYGIDAVGSGTWVDRRGEPTIPGRCAGRWSDGWPVWLQGGWRNARGRVTFPLDGGGWAAGPGGRPRSTLGVTFAPRPRPAARPWRTVAVDPALIPRGSRIYIPAYRQVNGGWFVAEDTGGAITGRHIDVFRPPPASPDDRGEVLRGQRVKVVPPGA